MEKIKGCQFSLSDYYVGELYISYELGNLLAVTPGIDQAEKTEEYIDLLDRGAIRFGKVGGEVDWENRRNYQSVLALFLKLNDEMVCLHNLKAYPKEGNDYYKNLQPLERYLQSPDKFQFQNLYMLTSGFVFDRLFNSKKMPIFYNPVQLHSLDEFFIGSLNLYESDITRDIAEKKMLYGRAYWTGFHGNESYNYDAFNCLFLSQDNGVLNLNNNIVYDKGVLNTCDYDRKDYVGSYYQWMRGLSTYLSERENSKYKQLTLKDATTLFNKYEIDANSEAKGIQKIIKKIIG